MINNIVNECTVSGYLYGFGRFGLTERDGKIGGSLVVLVDENTDTTVEVNFIPQSPTYKSGKENNTYSALKELMEKEPTIEKVGKEKAAKVRCNCRITTNPYYSVPKGRAGAGLELHEPMQIQGSFLHVDNKVEPYVGFNVDVLIEDIAEIEKNDEPTGEYMVSMKTYDDYRKFFRPLKMKITDPSGIAVIQQNLQTEEHYYTTISGTIVSKTVHREKGNSDMAFGSVATISKDYTTTDILIIGATPAKEFPVTEEEAQTLKNNRTTFLNERKQKAEEKNSATPTSKEGVATTTFAAGSKFSF